MIWAQLKRRWMRWRQPKEPWQEFARSSVSVLPAPEVEFSAEWREQLAFDGAFSRALQSEPVPAGLREAILKDGPHGASWPGRWKRPMRLALAAAAVGLLSLPALLSGPSTFAGYRDQIVAEAWSPRGHLDTMTGDLNEAQQWAQAQDAPWPTHFPKAFGEMQLAGCRVFRSQGQRVTLLCFANGMHHTHFFVMNRLHVPDQPGEQFPRLSTCGGWETVSWSRGDQTFILTGLKSMAFLKQFRREGHWSWSG